MRSVTVVLNGFKRQKTLARQVQSLKSQSYPVEKIMYWNLQSNDSEFIPDYEFLQMEGIEYATVSHDYGVWGRFTFALNSSSEFICIMDDDIVPGSYYIENCIACYEKRPGIYGTLGSSANFKNLYGWKGEQSKYPEEVMYLYQTWFMPREVLHSFWSEIISDDLTKNRHIGEDMRVSAAAKKFHGLNTYVVPHPADDTQWWGNIVGDQYGLDEYAVHLNPEMQVAMERYFRFSKKGGLIGPIQSWINKTFGGLLGNYPKK